MKSRGWFWDEKDVKGSSIGKQDMEYVCYFSRISPKESLCARAKQMQCNRYNRKSKATTCRRAHLFLVEAHCPLHSHLNDLGWFSIGNCFRRSVNWSPWKRFKQNVGKGSRICSVRIGWEAFEILGNTGNGVDWCSMCRRTIFYCIPCWSMTWPWFSRSPAKVRKMSCLVLFTKASYASWSSSCFSKEYARGWTRQFIDTINVNPPLAVCNPEVVGSTPPPSIESKTVVFAVFFALQGCETQVKCTILRFSSYHSIWVALIAFRYSMKKKVLSWARPPWWPCWLPFGGRFFFFFFFSVTFKLPFHALPLLSPHPASFRSFTPGASSSIFFFQEIPQAGCFFQMFCWSDCPRVDGCTKSWGQIWKIDGLPEPPNPLGSGHFCHWWEINLATSRIKAAWTLSEEFGACFPIWFDVANCIFEMQLSPYGHGIPCLCKDTRNLTCNCNWPQWRWQIAPGCIRKSFIWSQLVVCSTCSLPVLLARKAPEEATHRWGVSWLVSFASPHQIRLIA